LVPHPQPEDLQAIREEAIEAVVRLGANREAVDVAIDVDTTTGRVRATAIGAAELNVRDETGAISEAEARSIAAQALHVPVGALALRAEVAGFRVYGDEAAGVARMRVVDWSGLVRLQRRAGLVVATTAGDVGDTLAGLWREIVGDSGQAGVVLMHGRHLADLSGLDDLEQASAVARSEVDGLAREAPVVLLAAVETGVRA
jgi:hypothetical protein